MADNSTVFFSTPGNVVGITSKYGTKMLTLGLTNGSNQKLDNLVKTIGIVQNISLIGRTQLQVQLGMNGSMFVTPFGDQPGQVKLNTLLAPACVSNPGSTQGEASEAIGKFLRYYNDTKIKPSANLDPMYVSIGASTARGYLNGFELTGAVGNGQIYTGALTITTVQLTA